MKSTQLWVAAAVALIVVLGGVSAPARGDPAGNPVTEWNAIATTTLLALPLPAGGAPPAFQVEMGMTQGAVYDAVNATTPKHHRPYLLKRRFAATASKDAAVATAAYRVLSSIVSSVPEGISFPNRGSLLTSLAGQYASSLAAVSEGPFKSQGVAAGNAAADAMIADRQGDGRFAPFPLVLNPAPGHWQPLSNPDGSLILDPTPWVAHVRPFLIQSPSQFRTAGPNALTSPTWATEFNDVKALGALNSLVRTPEQTHIALFWQSAGGPAVLWNAVARDLVQNPSYAVDVADSARLFAMENLSAADAAINCWNDKYYWDFWRPWNAIPRAAEDGNPATEPEPGWTPLLSAPYPEHPSGHLCLDGAHLRVLQRFFGTDDVPFDVTSSRFPGQPQHFDRFSQALAQITEARIWAGLHYRTADIQGQQLGRNVADYMADNYFQAVGVR